MMTREEASKILWGMLPGPIVPPVHLASECKNKNNNLPCTRVKWVKMFSGARYYPNCGAKMDGDNE